MSFNSIGSLLPQRLKQSGLHAGVQTAQVIQFTDELLDDLFGEGTSKEQAKAMAFKHGVLRIACMNSCLKQEVHLRQQEIISLLHKKFNSQMIRRIQIII